MTYLTDNMILTAPPQAITQPRIFYAYRTANSVVALVLQEVMWATYYGRLSLETVRGLGMLITLGFAAVGAPFFGFLFYATGSYVTSFVLFALALLASAFLTLLAHAPQKQKLVCAEGIV